MFVDLNKLVSSFTRTLYYAYNNLEHCALNGLTPNEALLTY